MQRDGGAVGGQRRSAQGRRAGSRRMTAHAWCRARLACSINRPGPAALNALWQIVLVAYVDPRSATYAAGVRAGQRVTAVSDPVRAQEGELPAAAAACCPLVLLCSSCVAVCCPCEATDERTSMPPVAAVWDLNEMSSLR